MIYFSVSPCSQTLILDNAMEEINLPVVDFQKSPLISDISFKLSDNSDIITSQDLIQGRSNINSQSLVVKLKNMLIKASDYLKEHHLEMEEPNWNYGQLINKIHDTMTSMDLNSFEKLFHWIEHLSVPQDVTVR